MAIPYDRKTPHRFDIVGSFLRPAALKRARADLEAGTIDQAALTKVESQEISALIEREKSEEGNKLSEEDQWRKLALVRETAEEVWG